MPVLLVNTILADYLFGIVGDNWRMKPQTIQDIRRRNLDELIKADFGGRKASLARAMNTPANNISRFFSKSDHGRKISDLFAREIERAAGKPTGWLDVPHSLLEDPELERLIEEAKREALPELKAYLRGLLAGRQQGNH